MSKKLSPRMLQVLILKQNGLDTKQMAAFLAIKESTVKTYWTRIYSALDLSTCNRDEALKKCYELGILPEMPRENIYVFAVRTTRTIEEVRFAIENCLPSYSSLTIKTI